MAGKLAKLTALSQQRPQMSKEKVVENNVMVLNTLLNTSAESEYEYMKNYASFFSIAVALKKEELPINVQAHDIYILPF